ncbi:hypothetical protein [Marinobacter salsuginis]|jgi:hypothetical protein|uniref:Uncharacterized protein n=1 Tax=Marinobacter salsuginis TaxID=418719 RepID=A0A5M3Q3A8_9GAMM|nr:hypothetical protein [Marinobacter salsuginis]GBO89140.1 hypothetical protein MSSD14B_28080 [Marinobacter salsuginis]
MALMVLKRLPTEAELEKTSVEPHSFLNAFNNMHVSDFVADVEDKGEHVLLDGWHIQKADWFAVVD